MESTESSCFPSSVNVTIPSTDDSEEMVPTRDSGPLAASSSEFLRGGGGGGDEDSCAPSTLGSNPAPPRGRHHPALGTAVAARVKCRGGGREPRVPTPPLWTTSVREAPEFAGLLPYELPDPLDRLEVPLAAPAASDGEGDGDGSYVYVGLYADLRERLALLQATVDFDGDRTVKKHRELRDPVRSMGERVDRLIRKQRKLEELVERSKERLRQLNIASRRTGVSL